MGESRRQRQTGACRAASCTVFWPLSFSVKPFFAAMELGAPAATTESCCRSAPCARSPATPKHRQQAGSYKSERVARTRVLAMPPLRQAFSRPWAAPTNTASMPTCRSAPRARFAAMGRSYDTTPTPTCRSAPCARFVAMVVYWVPAFAGMTARPTPVIPANAGIQRRGRRAHRSEAAPIRTSRLFIQPSSAFPGFSPLQAMLAA
ncbi:hypothetical protein PSEWESI4_04088 [Pseudomonas carbonaria]|uniref:Uncharacterized protein n=1 Tax=Zestomonas carbonaria TaxID=2762745 RepID=A0A7U7ERF9_9GAMM|nr:hypothetical protein PSEWESI4_04088 [Pseudomonas carbonaria]